MKGLTLTLQVIIVAIVLLVTALVVMTIFGGQIGQFISTLNPWSENMLKQNLCSQKCAAWCQGNPGKPGIDWGTLKTIDAQTAPKDCASIMADIAPDCKCGIPTAKKAAGEACTTNADCTSNNCLTTTHKCA